jgi:hypothetical protein
LVKTQSQQPSQQSEESGLLGLEYSVANETISEELLLRCWNGAVQQVNEAVKINQESGAKHLERFIAFFDQAKPMNVTQRIRWLDSCRQKKSMEFITVNQLKSAGTLSDVEVKLFEGQTFPRRELTGMYRHCTHDKKQWLVRMERWIGLTSTTSVVSVPANDIDFTRRINFSPDSAPIDPTVQGSPHVRVVKVGACLPGYETAEKIYLTPFTKENVLAAMQKAQRPTEPSLHGHISLAISRDDRSSNPMTVPDLDTFVNANFEELWKTLTTPQPQININSKDLANYVKLDRESREAHQYT